MNMEMQCVEQNLSSIPFKTAFYKFIS
uniref:Uncharacterized protein n=1 Tax=Ciona intestinalis TaxID=7719 RepID=H2XWV0_CIOIN